MLILLLFAFFSGLVTIFAPCIWPLLPIILSSSTSGGKNKALGVTLGIMLSFAFFTLTISYIVKIIPFDPNALRLVAVIVIGFLGIVLLVPSLNQRLEGWVSRLSGRFSRTGPQEKKDSFGTGFVTGLSLGIVWTPCAGPILATIATLAATQSVNLAVVIVTVVYVIGVGIPLFFFSLAGNYFFTKSRSLSKYTGRIQQLFGLIMILTAIAIFTNADKTIQVRLLDAIPSYSNFINKLESNDIVTKQLQQLKGGGDGLAELGKAPDFATTNTWLNVDKPLTMESLKGKVVLVDFWTYTCINCIRTLPHVTSWYEKYKDQGFVVVGVHTPEFEFEKKTQNVQDAIKQYNIHYPVAQDNDYATWQAYDNHYWPAKYLIDANGTIRRTHFGEGEYEEMEMAIKDLLKEAGKKVDDALLEIEDTTPQGSLTPETYLGLSRMERYGGDETPHKGVQSFSKVISIPEHYFAFSGTWDIDEEFSQTKSQSGLQIHFNAGRVFLVIHPQTVRDTVTVYLDGHRIRDTEKGEDVVDGEVTVTEPRLYDLVNLHNKSGSHTLQLEFETEGTQVFAFTFGS